MTMDWLLCNGTRKVGGLGSRDAEGSIVCTLRTGIRRPHPSIVFVAVTKDAQKLQQAENL